MDKSRLFPIGAFQIKPRVDVPTWACEHRYMESTSAMFSYDQTPFFELPAHYMSDIAGTGAVILKTPSQLGKTTTIENMLGWVCEYDRANTMIVLDTQKSGLKMSKNRIRPFLRDVCGINNPNNTTKNPDKSNQVSNIGLGRGANLMIASAKSASDLRSTPCKFMFMDELDAWPDELKGEGDPVQLALGRMMRYRGMCVMTSTPTSYEGRIMQQFLVGTRQTWGVFCECGCHLSCRWDDIDFSSDTPTITCPQCGTVYSEADVRRLKHGYSEPQNPTPYSDDYKRIWRSFEVFGTLCHSFYTWDGLKRAEITALSLGESSYQSFRNTKLAETYKPKDEIEVQIPDLMRVCVTSYTPDNLPIDIAFIVMGIDTHDSCLYVETCGFSENLKRIYGIDYRVIVGDPNDADVWNQLTSLMNTVYTFENGRKIRPSFAFCDSGGHRSNAVYLYSFRNKRFMPIKGFVSNARNAVDPLLGKQLKMKMGGGVKGKCLVQYLGVNAGKDQLAQMEILSLAGDKHLFFPKKGGYDDQYFRGLLSEKKIGGRWVAPLKGHTNNEPLDCRIYAIACAEYYYNRYYLTGKDREQSFDNRGDTMAKKKKVEEQDKEIKPVDEPQKVEEQQDKGIKPVDEKPKKVLPHW